MELTRSRVVHRRCRLDPVKLRQLRERRTLWGRGVRKVTRIAHRVMMRARRLQFMSLLGDKSDESTQMGGCVSMGEGEERKFLCYGRFQRQTLCSFVFDCLSPLETFVHHYLYAISTRTPPCSRSNMFVLGSRESEIPAYVCFHLRIPLRRKSFLVCHERHECITRDICQLPCP